MTEKKTVSHTRNQLYVKIMKGENGYGDDKREKRNDRMIIYFKEATHYKAS
jgi:hypothetical protein